MSRARRQNRPRISALGAPVGPAAAPAPQASPVPQASPAAQAGPFPRLYPVPLLQFPRVLRLQIPQLDLQEFKLLRKGSTIKRKHSA